MADGADMGNMADGADMGNMTDGADMGNMADGADMGNMADGEDMRNMADGGDMNNFPVFHLPFSTSRHYSRHRDSWECLLLPPPLTRSSWQSHI